MTEAPPRLDRSRLAATILAVAAVYVAFLLCAQFGFLAGLEAELGRDSRALRAVLAAMGAGGLGGAFAAARAGRRAAVAARPAAAVRFGLLATAAAAAGSLAPTTVAGFALAAAALGGALGFVTVALAGSLAALVPARRSGLVAGAGTGIAYLVSNLPPLFGGVPAVRALVPAAICVVAAVLLPRRGIEDSIPVVTAAPASRWLFAGMVFAFFVLVAVDSEAFASIQRSPAALATSWGGAPLQLRQGAVHLLAALLAGLAIDRRGLGGALVAAAALFVAALPSLDVGGSVAHLAAMLYAAGISAYSAALVAAPTRLAGGRVPLALQRAAWLYAVAGWIGSGLGVAVANRPAPAAAPPAVTSADLEVARGRAIYLAEGCQHCHSQYVRPATDDELRWGPRRPFDRNERPPTPGNRRLGPDLTNAGLRRSALWHELHLRDPRAVSPGSRMPSYAHLFAGDGAEGRALVAYLGALGRDAERERAADVARWQAPDREGDAVRGGALFARHCAPCHGAAGRGDGPLAARLPRPLLDLGRGALARAVPARATESRAAAVARTVRFGLAPGTMPGHEWLSDEEVADLAAFVLGLVDQGRASEGAG